MNQFEIEKLMRANMDICGKICTKKARNDTKSSLKCHGNILFYTSTRHRNTTRCRVSTTSMKRREVTSINDVSYRSERFERSCCSKKVIFLQTCLKFAVATFLEVRKIPIKVRENLQTSCQ